MFRRSCALIGFNSTAFFGSLVFTALYLQEGRGFSAIQSGLSTFPEAVGVGLSSQIVARLFPKIGPRRLLAAGFAGLAIATAFLARAGLETSLWDIRALCFFLGASLAFIMLPNQAAAFAQISPAASGHASAIYNTLQRSLSSIGVAFLSTVLALAGGDVLHGRIPIAAFHWVFGVNVGLAVVGMALALRIHDSDAAAAMGRTTPR
jgi:MFS family permease